MLQKMWAYLRGRGHIGQELWYLPLPGAQCFESERCSTVLEKKRKASVFVLKNQSQLAKQVLLCHFTLIFAKKKHHCISDKLIISNLNKILDNPRLIFLNSFVKVSSQRFYLKTSYAGRLPGASINNKRKACISKFAIGIFEILKKSSCYGFSKTMKISKFVNLAKIGSFTSQSSS